MAYVLLKLYPDLALIAGSVQSDSLFRCYSDPLFDYALSGGHPDAWCWWIASRFLGYANPFPGRRAGEIGLSEYGARKDWTDDAAGIVGKFVASGWRATHAEANREAARAKAAEERAVHALRNARGIMGRIRRPELRRRLRAAGARRSLTLEAALNVGVVRYFLSGETPFTICS